MNAMLRIVARLGHAVHLRSELAAELKRQAKHDGRVSKRVWWNLLRQPAAVDDAIYIRRFVDFSTPVLIVDAGGNTGFWAAKMRAFFARCKVIGFEPASSEFAQYVRRFEGNVDVAAHQVALSDVSGVGYLALAADTLYSHLMEDSTKSDVPHEPVQLRRLDEYASEIDAMSTESQFNILKIDVQGNELKVLKGARNVLDKFRLVYLECSFASERLAEPTFAAASEELLRHGFHPVIFRDFGRTKGPFAIERDVIFVRAADTAKIIGY